MNEVSHNKSRRILITGASSGVGRSIAIEHAKAGDDLLLIGYTSKRLAKVKDECEKLGSHVRAIQHDVTDVEASSELLEQFFREGEIDVFYDFAARALGGEAMDINIEDWEWILDQSLYSSLHWITEVYKHMVRQRFGRIMISSSIAGLSSYPGFSGYAASKKALYIFHQSLHQEAARKGIQMHVMCAGYIDTNIFKSGRLHKVNLDAFYKEIPFRMVTSEKAAQMILKEIAKGRKVIIFPFYAKMIAFFYAYMPFMLKPLYKEAVRKYRKIKHLKANE